MELTKRLAQKPNSKLSLHRDDGDALLRRGRDHNDRHGHTIHRARGYVLCGGDLTSSQKVSEQYLLDIEREAFLSLLGNQKTLDRIQYMLMNNKPLRN